MIVDDKLMMYVLYKKRTENEVRRKCSLLKFDRDYTDEVIEYLKEADYINDKRYVTKYINDIKKLKHMSANQIRNDLIKRGIDSYLAEDIASSEEINDFEFESALYFLNKKLRAGEELEKVKKYLLNKGYSYSNVTKAIDNLEDINDN